MKTLEKLIENYLLMRIDKGYSQETINSHRKMLDRYVMFARRHAVSDKDAIGRDHFDRFLSECRLAKARYAINGFKKYLISEGMMEADVCRGNRHVLPDIYEQYMAYYRRTGEASDSRVRFFRSVLSVFNDFLEKSNTSLQNLSIDVIDGFFGEYHKGMSPSTRRKDRSVIRLFLQYLYDERKLLKRNLAPLITAAPNYGWNIPPRYLRPDEIKQLFDSLALSTPDDLRTNAIVRLAYTTGLRVKEIVLITLDDLSFSKGDLKVPVRKGGNPAIFPLPEMTIKAIAAYIVGGRPESQERRLFLEITAPFRPISAYVVKNCINNAMRKAGIEGSSYWLRHTYAQNLLESGASIFDIKDMLGHDDIKTTSRYLHVHIKLMREVLFDE